MKDKYGDILGKIRDADAIVIGAGSGLSTASGLTYSGERFEEHFGDFIKKYGLKDMYSSGFYPFKTEEERWAYWSRHAMINRYSYDVGSVYLDLLDMINNKEYFVITTNVDHQFFRAGFDPSRIFATQGDYGALQCSKACHNKVYDNKAIMEEMIERQKDMKIPSDLIPKCPVCGEVMEMHLRKDDSFVEDEAWHEAQGRYQAFLNKYSQSKILFLELGVGMNTPGIIKYSFWRLTHQLDAASFVCLNMGQAWAPDEIREKSLVLNVDIKEAFDHMKLLSRAF